MAQEVPADEPHQASQSDQSPTNSESQIERLRRVEGVAIGQLALVEQVLLFLVHFADDGAQLFHQLLPAIGFDQLQGRGLSAVRRVVQRDGFGQLGQLVVNQLVQVAECGPVDGCCRWSTA